MCPASSGCGRQHQGSRLCLRTRVLCCVCVCVCHMPPFGILPNLLPHRPTLTRCLSSLSPHRLPCPPLPPPTLALSSLRGTLFALCAAEVTWTHPTPCLVAASIPRSPRTAWPSRCVWGHECLESAPLTSRKKGVVVLCVDVVLYCAMSARLHWIVRHRNVSLGVWLAATPIT
jgi:hypothetical protein